MLVVHTDPAARWVKESPADCATRLNISLEAAQLFHQSDVIDLHVDSFIWQRIFSYRIDKEHGRGLLGARFYSQVDLPRLRHVGVSGATWVITTNPFKGERRRSRALEANLARLEATLDAQSADVARVATFSHYIAARTAGKHAAFVGIQGGNALGSDLGSLGWLGPERLLRVTLTHLSNSDLGQTSSPVGNDAIGLSDQGRDLVRWLNEKRIFVDLAHINRRGFFDALAVHDTSVPPLVTHTGVSGVRPHWRNIDDEQLRAIADRQGVVGVMYHTPFLRAGMGRHGVDAVCEHLEHVVRTVGDDVPALGSDWDGAIVTPKDMPTCLELPRLVERLLRRGMHPTSIQKILGGNFLRALRQLRG